MDFRSEWAGQRNPEHAAWQHRPCVFPATLLELSTEMKPAGQEKPLHAAIQQSFAVVPTETLPFSRVFWGQEKTLQDIRQQSCVLCPAVIMA